MFSQMTSHKYPPSILLPATLDFFPPVSVPSVSLLFSPTADPTSEDLGSVFMASSLLASHPRAVSAPCAQTDLSLA